MYNVTHKKPMVVSNWPPIAVVRVEVEARVRVREIHKDREAGAGL